MLGVLIVAQQVAAPESSATSQGSVAVGLAVVAVLYAVVEFRSRGPKGPKGPKGLKGPKGGHRR